MLRFSALCSADDQSAPPLALHQKSRQTCHRSISFPLLYELTEGRTQPDTNKLKTGSSEVKWRIEENDWRATHLWRRAELTIWFHRRSSVQQWWFFIHTKKCLLVYISCFSRHPKLHFSERSKLSSCDMFSIFMISVSRETGTAILIFYWYFHELLFPYYRVD